MMYDYCTRCVCVCYLYVGYGGVRYLIMYSIACTLVLCRVDLNVDNVWMCGYIGQEAGFDLNEDFAGPKQAIY